MESNGYAVRGAMVNGSKGGPKMNGSAHTNARPLTVDEALPYSPFSSVVPFNSGTHHLSWSSHFLY
jgi:cohesin loading factor subunit SCC2